MNELIALISSGYKITFQPEGKDSVYIRLVEQKTELVSPVHCTKTVKYKALAEDPGAILSGMVVEIEKAKPKKAAIDEEVAD